MLISRVCDDDGAGEGRKSEKEQNHLQEYRTATELFELMAKNHTFNPNDEPLSTSDLVILYKNIDLGTRLLNTTNELKRPNRRVETVVYNDDDSDSSSEICTDEMRELFLINKERIDLLNSSPSLENTLCHKLGDLKIKTSNLATDYKKRLLLKDPYIKEHLKLMSSTRDVERSIFPSSLLDYICCKKLEENYNFDMENVISYVKHTIEHLRRISNGDYLTEKAKQKWREVQMDSEDIIGDRVLATSTSIPLRVERKVQPGHSSLWDDIVHSEVDIRSLSKILEKKIIVEVPKVICGSYRLFTKQCDDNLIISCKRAASFGSNDQKRKRSRVDVVFQLKRSDSGHVVSNISSIMILQATPEISQENGSPEVLPLLPTDEEVVGDLEIKDENLETDMDEEKSDENIKEETDIDKIEDLDSCVDDEHDVDASRHDTSPCIELDATVSGINIKKNENSYFKQEYKPNPSTEESSVSSITLMDILKTKLNNNEFQQETSHDMLISDELQLSMRQLNIQSAFLEESSGEVATNKKKTPTRVRIKSPYENKSFVIEERKRKRLLEIRERREKRKLALSENCKIEKHKYSRGALMPQPSSSVTKLSITNKSFYNSIYGQNENNDVKHPKLRRKRSFPVGQSQDIFGEETNVSLQSHDAKKYINRSYYLDDTVTEIMHMESKHEERKKDGCSASMSSSAISTDFGPHFSIFSQLITTDGLQSKDLSLTTNAQCDTETILNEIPYIDTASPKPMSNNSRSEHGIVPTNTPKDRKRNDEINFKRAASTLECRKSIDKIYDLMKTFGKTDCTKISSYINSSKNIERESEKIDVMVPYLDNSTAQASDSGTSLKHHPLSSDFSGFSFQKMINTDTSVSNMTNKQTETPAAVVPKIVISTKTQVQRTDTEKGKKERKKVTINAPKSTPPNPLKAISHLLQEFDNVQKNRQHRPDVKPNKKGDFLNDERNNHVKPQRPFAKRTDHNIKDMSPRNINVGTPKDRKSSATVDIPKIIHHQTPVHEKNIDKNAKKKIADIIDEAREARGEAVRGPPKASRLNSLAQPKKHYVQAHSEEYHNKYGRSAVADRLQRLSGTPQSPLALEKSIGYTSWKNKPRRSTPGVVSPLGVKPPPPTSPLERGTRVRRSSSPDANNQPPPAEAPCKPKHVSDAPETLKNKMVAVESYVKLHYGRVKSPPVDQHIRKSRVPLMPTDLELSSLTSSPPAEESTAVGSKLHNIINTIISDHVDHGLKTLSECPETVSKSKATDDLSQIEKISKGDKSDSLDSDYHLDVSKDTILLERVDEVENEKSEIDLAKSIEKTDLKQFNSLTELRVMENTLQRPLSIGSFQKRLRIKQNILASKQSRQQVILQSGDANPLLLKSSRSQSLKSTGSFSKMISDFKDLSAWTSPNLNWNLSAIPMQIATVAYSFPQYQALKQNVRESLDCVSLTRTKSTENVDMCKPLDKNITSDETNRYFDGQELLNTKNVQQRKSCDLLVSLTNEDKAEVVSKEKISNIDPLNNHQTLTTSHTVTSIDTKLFIPETFMGKKREGLEYTTSLDMLVGLLNEIQKITTCQTQRTDPDNDNAQCKDLETILNNAATLESVVDSPHGFVSITTSQNKLRLDSSQSIYSFYLSKDVRETEEKQTSMTPEIVASVENIVCADKEVNVDIPNKMYSNEITDVQSKFLPVVVNHSTYITNSLIENLRKQSTSKIASDKQYQDFSNMFNSQIKIIDLSRTEIIEPRESPALSKSESPIENITVATKKIANIDRKSKDYAFPKTITNVKNNNFPLLVAEKDPLLRIKRDILVTVYSMLVLTVFAALSFPELVYRV